MPSFATGAARANPNSSTVYAPDARRPVRMFPTPSYGHPGQIGPATGATGTSPVDAPPIARWTGQQMFRPASPFGNAGDISQPANLYSGGEYGWSTTQGTGLNEPLYADHAQRIARLWRTGMTGASGLDGQMSTQQSADGTAGLSGHAPILSPALIPKLRSRQGFSNQLNRGGISNGNVPAVFVPVGMGPSRGGQGVR